MDAIAFGHGMAVGAAVRVPGFDFTRGVLPPGAMLTRASAGSRYTAAGVLASEAANVARFDYDPVTLAPRGLLIEAASSNAVQWSTDWTNAYWTKANLATTQATALIETSAANAAHTMQQATGDVTLTAGQAVTLSVIAAERAGSGKRYLLLSAGGAPAFSGTTSVIFNLGTGAVSASANVTASGVVALGGGASLCWMTATPVAAASGQAVTVRLNGIATAANVYGGDGTSGLNVTHLQIEPGGVASSRIVTAGTAGTRAVDALVLGWGGIGVPDGAITVRYTFDDGSTQDVATTVSGGAAAVPATLARAWIKGARKV